jgi:hypothetical protein
MKMIILIAKTSIIIIMKSAISKIMIYPFRFRGKKRKKRILSGKSLHILTRAKA